MNKTLPTPNSEKKAIATPKALEAPKPAVRVNKDHTLFTDRTGRDLYVRDCYKTGPHTPHEWMSYWFGGTPKINNAVCSGHGVPPSAEGGHYTKYNSPGVSVYKKKVDYSEDAENFPVSDPITVTQARAIAYDMHKDQKDKAGQPYRLHLNAVQKGVVVLGGDAEEQIAALFHDAVEDFHTTYELLKKINVTDRSLVMIEAVSKRSSEEQTKYRDRIVNAGKDIPKALADIGITKDSVGMSTAGQGATRVKVADLLHNLRHDRVQVLLDDSTKKYTAQRQAKKYKPMLAYLLMNLDLIVEEADTKIATKPVGTAWGGTTTPPKSTTVEKNTKAVGKSWSVASLLRGDWVSGWSAPIRKRNVNDDNMTIDFHLCDGSVRTEAKFMATGINRPAMRYAYAIDQWWKDTTLRFPGCDEDMIVAFHSMLGDSADIAESLAATSTDDPLPITEDDEFWASIEEDKATGRYAWDEGF